MQTLDSIENEILRFPPRKISFMVTNLLKKSNLSSENASKKFNIDISVIEQILSFPDFYSMEMYDSSSKILNKTIDELTSFETVDVSMNFRKKKKNLPADAQKDLDLAINLFKEISLNYKIKERI